MAGEPLSVPRGAQLQSSCSKAPQCHCFYSSGKPLSHAFLRAASLCSARPSGWLTRSRRTSSMLTPKTGSPGGQSACSRLTSLSTSLILFGILMMTQPVDVITEQ